MEISEILIQSIQYIGIGIATTFLSGIIIWAISLSIRAFAEWISER